MKDWRASTALAGVCLAAASTSAQAAINPDELLGLSLEQLSNVQVTSVSKRSENANEAAAAIYVISQDDIRRSGMTSIPEILRMVPGLNVAQSGSHQWAISSRGFNDQFANKLLVLIDGRSVYTPLYSGVYWDVQDTPLQDIERIEVIRGPGATLWGANAVNGVINIITKNAKDTQGGFVSESAGNLVNSLTTARYGAKIDDNAYARFYAKYDDYDELETMTETRSRDAWNKAQAGFRSDWKQGENNTYTLQGDMYRSGNSGTLALIQPSGAFLPTSIGEVTRGGNMLGRWEHKFSKNSNVTLQMYYDNAQRESFIFDSRLQTFDFDMQHVWHPAEAHDIVWGAGYRLVKSSLVGNAGNALGIAYIQTTPTTRDDNLYSAFIQDKIALIPNEFFLTIGSKVEHNEYTGIEFQPSARVSWLVDSKQTLWASVSKAVRTPNISTTNGQVLTAPVGVGPLILMAQSGGDTKSEELMAYELGYRVQPQKQLSFDFATFYNDYHRLLLGTAGATVFPLISPVIGAYGIVPILPTNVGTGHSWGLEASAKWNPTSIVELGAGYTLQQLKFDQPDPFGYSFGGKSPEQQFNLRSTLFLPHNVEVSNALYYVDALDALDVVTGQNTRSYTRFDMRVAWKPIDSLELSLVGQNLFDPFHKEFNGFLYQSSSQVPRAVYGNVTYKF